MSSRRFALGCGLLMAALFLASPDVGAPKRTAFPGVNGRIVFSTGTDLGTSGEVGGGTYTVNARGRGLRRLPIGIDAEATHWSPNGREIVFSGFRCAIRIAKSNGIHSRCVTNADYFDPNWSPDGSRIVAWRNVSSVGSFVLDILNRKGTVLTRIPIAAGVPLAPAWSPHGDRIAFALEYNGGFGKSDIYDVRPDGTGLEQLTTDGASGQPSWSPDGAHILFVRDEFGLWTMAPNGSNQRHILVVPDASDNPNVEGAAAAWSPDGTKIAYSSVGARWIAIYNLQTRRHKTMRMNLPRRMQIDIRGGFDWQAVRRLPPLRLFPLSAFKSPRLKEGRRNWL